MGACGCIRLLPLALENANAVLHLRQRFLRTHRTGQLGNVQWRERDHVSAGTHQTPWALGEVALPPRPALPTEATGTIGQSRRSCALFSSKAGSGGLHSSPKWEEARRRARLSYFGATLHPVSSWLPVLPSSPDTEEEKLEGAGQSKPPGGCRGVGGPGPSHSPLRGPLSLFLDSPASRPKLPAYSAAGAGVKQDE